MPAKKSAKSVEPAKPASQKSAKKAPPVAKGGKKGPGGLTPGGNPGATRQIKKSGGY